ncbi:MAG: glycerophosphodiester phosphodiesterase [Verrucomicrobiota bacterium]
MKPFGRVSSRKLLIGFVVVIILFLGLGAYFISQFNIPYNVHEGLADIKSTGKPQSSKETRFLTIIGHRGSGLENVNPSSGGKTQGLIGNTRRAIREGLDARVDWIEIDLRRTKDGKLVLFHDDTIDFKTNGEGKLSELSLKTLHNFEVSVDPPERILTWTAFHEGFLKDLRSVKAGLILDVKERGLGKDLLNWINEPEANDYFREGQLIVFGEYEVLEDYKDKGLKLGYTFTWSGKGNRFRYLFHKKEIIERLKSVGADLLVVPVIFASRDLIEQAKEEGIETWTYGSDDPRDWDRSRALGATGLIVDTPAVARTYYPSIDRRDLRAQKSDVVRPATGHVSDSGDCDESQPDTGGALPISETRPSMFDKR